MKIALPIALVTFGIVLVVILMSTHHWKVRTYADWQADHDKIEQAKQKWFDQNLEMKAEELDLTSKYQQAEIAVRTANQAKYEANAAIMNHDLKVRDELVKNDPSLNSAYDRLALTPEFPSYRAIKSFSSVTIRNPKGTSIYSSQSSSMLFPQ